MNLTEEIAGLKKQPGKDIIVFGGAGFVSSLIQEGLIDEYHLIINPTAMSSGMTIFNSLDTIQKFTPIQSKLYPGGKTILSFKPKNDCHFVLPIRASEELGLQSKTFHLRSSISLNRLRSLKKQERLFLFIHNLHY